MSRGSGRVLLAIALVYVLAVGAVWANRTWTPQDGFERTYRRPVQVVLQVPAGHCSAEESVACIQEGIEECSGSETRIVAGAGLALTYITKTPVAETVLTATVTACELAVLVGCFVGCVGPSESQCPPRAYCIDATDHCPMFSRPVAGVCYSDANVQGQCCEITERE